MAKSRATAPGTSTRNGVHGTMDAPFTKARKGSQNNMSGTFDQARSGGDNGLPTKIYDQAGGPKPGGVGVATRRDSPGTIMTSRKDRR